jgi:hypothetical protein
MSERGHLRTSDADRERIAERLRHAAAEGRIAPEELDERLGTALTARTYAELDSVVADLPGPKPARRRRHDQVTVPRVALAMLAAVVVVVVAITALAIAGALWVLWIVFGTLFLGKHRAFGGPCGRRRAHYLHARQTAGGPGRGYWA